MFLVCGEALYDVFLDGGDNPAAFAMNARAGGSPFNVAMGLARLEQRLYRAIPAPDLVFFLKAPVSVAVQRNATREKKGPAEP